MPTTTLLLSVLALASPQEPTPAPATATVDVSPAVRATNELGIALYRALDKEQPGKNLFFSPLSISVAMAMLAEGARDETAAELRGALHLDPKTPLADLHADFHALLARFREGGGNGDPELRARARTLRKQLDAAMAEVDKLSPADEVTGAEVERRAYELGTRLAALVRQVDRYELCVADALWVDRRFPIASGFVETLDRYYGTGCASPIDVANDLDGARRSINTWLAGQTRNRIRELPPEAVTQRTALMLGSAVLFRGEWADPFAVGETHEEEFRLHDGSALKAPLMHDSKRYLRYGAFHRDGTVFRTPDDVPKAANRGPPRYPADDGFTMIELPYKGEELAMLVVAPRVHDGLPKLERLLTVVSLASWCDSLQRRLVDTAMPRFEQRSALELSGALQAIGVHRAFVSSSTSNSAQFSGLAADPDAAHRLFVNRVDHQTWLQVREEGTEAVASIAIGGSAIGVLPEEWVPFTPVFRADHPFLFLIRDTKSGAILFLGRVVDPRT